MHRAQLVAEMGTCARRRVGCVIVDAFNRQVSDGFNGVASGLPHCNEGHPCSAAGAMSGVDLDFCDACHAEQNALIRCADPSLASTVYVTCSPCVSCVKLLMGTGIYRIVYAEEYPHPRARDLWLASDRGRRWERIAP
jgi:dCMP deaminase